MSKPPTGALVPAGPSALSGLSHLAARTLAERAARANALTIARTLIEAGRRKLAQFPEQAIQVVPTTDREAVPALPPSNEAI